jgi:guanylate kinase
VDPSFRLAEPAFPIVVSGPSGVGKTVLCRRLLDSLPHLVRSVSATTRRIRPGEQDGASYYFWDEKRFAQERDGGALLEWALVHGHHYGTPRVSLEERLAAGLSVVLNIDVQGAAQIRRSDPRALLIFVLPPSMAELARRLRGRETDDEDEIRRRLRTAAGEVARLPEYDALVVNDSLEMATEDLISIVRAERLRVARRVSAGWRLPALQEE